jgi:single-stranded-DNA-specific exonuclease
MTKGTTEIKNQTGNVLPEWRLLKFDEEKISIIRDHFGCSDYIARSLLFNRQEDIKQIEEYLNPKIEKWLTEPVFPSMEKGVLLLADLIKQNKKICVHGDFDTDGIFSTAVLMMCLKAVGCDCVSYIPDRTKGHGLSLESLEEVKKMNVDAVITVDCGINAIEEAQFLKENNIDLIVTDHHLQDDELPEALAIINPQLDIDPSYKVLSGAGISYRLGILLCNTLPPERIKKREFMNFMGNGHICAAIATIADVVPLTGFNRILVASALEKINHCELEAIKGLLKVSGLKDNITAEDLAFQVIPRINAAQRMAREGIVWELLNCRESERIEEICKTLDELNTQRKRTQREHYEKILSKCKDDFAKTGVPAGIVISGDEWTEGISGLIASNIMDQFHRPVCVILNNGAVGLASCRAPSHYHLKNALDECGEHLLSYGGHSGAAGFKIEEGNIQAFRASFEKAMVEQRESIAQSKVVAKLPIICEVNRSMLDNDFISEVSKLEPFGKDNEKPLFALRDMSIDGNPRYIGVDKTHIIVNFHKQGQSSISTIGFGLAEQMRHLDQFGRFDIVFSVGISKFTKKIQLQIRAMRQHIRRPS